MVRLEAAIRSPIAFRREIRDGIVAYASPETVGIVFDGRLFVWHAFPEPQVDPILDALELGPTVTSVLGDDSYEDVATELERFLSALAYYYQQPAEAVSYGSHSAGDPYDPPHASARRSHSGWMLAEPYDAMSLRRDSEPLLKALAWYREGLNAGSPFHRFLAHWNCLEAALADRRARFVNLAARERRWQWGSYAIPANPADHFREASRKANAHVRRRLVPPLIDPDADEDRQRLDRESRFLEVLARTAIEAEFGHPVSTR